MSHLLSTINQFSPSHQSPQNMTADPMSLHLIPLPLGLARPLPLEPLALPLPPAAPLPNPRVPAPIPRFLFVFVILGVIGGGGARLGVCVVVVVAFETILVDPCSTNEVSVVLDHTHHQHTPTHTTSHHSPGDITVQSIEGRVSTYINVVSPSLSLSPELSAFPAFHLSKLSCTGASGKSTQKARTFNPYKKAAKLSPNRARLSCMSWRCMKLASRSAMLSASSANWGSRMSRAVEEELVDEL